MPSPTDRRSATSTPYHHGDLRRALVQAALEMLTEVGPAQLSLRAVARRAGVSEAAPYRHFADKETLLACVAEEGFRALGVEVTSAIDDLVDPAERFRAHGLAYVRFALGNPQHYRLMFGPEVAEKQSHPGLEAAAEGAYLRLEESLGFCSEAGLLRRAEVSTMAVAAWSVVHGFSSLVIDGQIRELAGRGPSTEAMTMAASVTDLLFVGLLSR
jgi:AcrR family transcriptional regulator